MRRIRKLLLATLYLVATLFSPSRVVRAQDAVVHAILFYSPACGHCHYVITEVLPPLFEKYGGQLQVMGVDVSQPDGQALFKTVLLKYNLESGRIPFLLIGDIYLIGSGEIPDQFPGMIEQYLAQGGIDWPDIPGLVEVPDTTEDTQSPTLTPNSKPVVRAVLFYRSTCGPCQELVEKVVPPLFQEYGNQLEIFGMDVSLPDGNTLYMTAIERFNITQISVPLLIAGDHVLIGLDIQQKFPAIIEEYLMQGGLDWPDLPGLDQALITAQSSATPTQVPGHGNTPMAFPTASPQVAVLTATPGLLLSGDYPTGPSGRFALDPVGNSLSLMILLGMIVSLVWGTIHFFRPQNAATIVPKWVIPALCVIGLSVAAYLAYVEITLVTAVCGPVGDCNTVQQSEYARLFGVLPIGVLGMVGYALLILAWLVEQVSKGNLSNFARLASLAMSTFGILFSIYLTFLEPFIIGATCAWCLTSALVMTGLFLLSIDPGKRALFSLQGKPHPSKKKKK
jgi:uncharacterized membrane protein/thiol-disulfide isomerase/thioredoxin